MVTIGHDKKSCTCMLYKLDFKANDLRWTKDTRYCKSCAKYITLKKWHGGIAKFGNRIRILTKEFCPCCGERLRTTRRQNAKMIRSIKDQIKNPQNYRRSSVKLDNKMKFIKENNLLKIKNRSLIS